MNKDSQNFIKEGLLRYKNATNTYYSFRKEVQNLLQEILRNRKDWGNVKPNYKSIKSTTFGNDYPLLNSRIEGEFKEQKVIIVIAINWYQSDLNTPFYCVWGENHNFLENIISSPDEKFELVDNQLRYYPTFNKLTLERDFNDLLGEYVKYIKE